MSYARGDYVLEQEKYAATQIENANKEKDDLLRKAKEAAKKEMATYDAEKNNENMQKITELNSNYEVIEELKDKNEQEIKKIEECYEKNKQQVIDYLFENVLTVKYEVPDVVKGFFEEKFGMVDK